MNSNAIRKKVSGLVLTLGLMFAVVGLSAAKASAQDYNQDRDDYYQYGHDHDRYGHDDDDDYCRYGHDRFTEADARYVGSVNGYEFGFRHGREDGRYGRSFEF